MSEIVRLMRADDDDFWTSEVYLSYVRRWLHRDHDVRIDPFDPRRPADNNRLNETFIDRAGLLADLEAQSQTSNIIVYGREGSGRRTLAGMLAQSSQSSHTLFVPVRLDAGVSPGAANANQTAATAPASSRWRDLFARALFAAYWRALFGDPQARRRHLPNLGVNILWLHALRQLHHRFAVDQPLPEDPDLAEWLRQPSPDVTCFILLSDVEAFNRLIEFALGPAYPTPFECVHWLIDATQIDALSVSALRSFKETVQWLHEYRPGLHEIRFTLLAHDGERDEFGSMPCVASGQARQIDLPPWTETHLHKMLGQRVSTLCPGQWEASWENTIAPQLRDLLRKTLSLADVRDLCQNLGIDWDNLAGTDMQDKTWELVEHLTNHVQIENALTCLHDMAARKGHPKLEEGLRRLEESKPAAWTVDLKELDPPARQSAPALVVKGALKCCGELDRLDAPYHALRLARGLVAACADPRLAGANTWVTTDCVRRLISEYQQAAIADRQ